MSNSLQIESTTEADVQLLVDLVSTPSVSGHERAAAERFIEHASARGLTTQIDDAGNACAHRGPDSAAVHIVMLGHIDTVPGDIPVTLNEGVLHGRGTVDAKGPLCAMLCAASRAVLPDQVRLSVIGAVGEETAGSPGARFLAPRLRPDACIIGEPSAWNGVTLGYKGRLLANASISRPNHHSAGEQASASDEVIAWWSRVLDSVSRFNADQRGTFASIQATVQAMRSSSDGLTQQAALEAGFRLPTGVTPDGLACDLRSLSGDEMTIEFSSPELAHVTDRNDPVVRALSTSIRAEGGRPLPKLKTGTADLNVVGPVWNCPIAAYGPGDSALDHTPREHLDLAEYARSIRVLSRAITILAEELVG